MIYLLGISVIGFCVALAELIRNEINMAIREAEQQEGWEAEDEP